MKTKHRNCDFAKGQLDLLLGEEQTIFIETLGLSFLQSGPRRGSKS